jgi:adenylate cyclase, class 2
MEIEYEATFTNINKNDIREKLKKLGAKLVKQEFLMKRVVFNMPEGHEIKGGWLRVRDEGDKITMSLKVIENGKIENQKEIMVGVDNFNSAVSLLEATGCGKKAYQETKREIWDINGVDICIDEWPFLKPFVEVEAVSEEAVKKVSGDLGFDYSKALFCGVGHIYELQYGIDENVVNKEIPLIKFEMKNPFIR